MQMDALRLALLVASALAPGCSAPSDSSFDGNDTGETLTWCDAEPILQNKCQRCHRDPPENGAPFALITYADTQVKHDTTPRYELMQAAVANGFMPFVAADLDPPVAPLTCEEKETLLAWLAADAPAAPSDDPECDEVVPQELSCP